MHSLRQMIRATENFRPDGFIASDPKAVRIRYHNPTKQLRVQAKFAGSRGEEHMASIVYEKVKESAAKKGIVTASVVGGSGTVGIAPPSIGSKAVLVSCSCPDYMYTFYNPLKEQHYGKPPVFPPAKGMVGVPRNPGNVAGVCKHIRSLAEHLKDTGFFEQKQVAK